MSTLFTQIICNQYSYTTYMMSILSRANLLNHLFIDTIGSSNDSFCLATTCRNRIQFIQI